MSNSLEERLKSNSSAFEGLLSLIPAKYYYDEKTQEQWKAKKKSKGQLKEDKKAKLDPEQQNEESGSALDVLKKKQASAKPVVLPGQRKMPIEEEVEEEAEADQEASEVSEVASVGESESITVVFDDDGNPVDGNSSTTETPSKASNKELSKEQALKEEALKKKKMEELRSKLQEKIKALKEKRKAPGTKVDGAPSSREAILAQRKRRQEARAAKKLDSENPGDVSSDDSGADSDSDSEVEDGHVSKKQRRGDDEISAKDVMFQSIEFSDGTKATSDLSHVRKGERKKGPAKKDVKAHLRLLESKKQSIESKDELDQIKIKEKEKWQKAMLQAEGIRIRDDEKLLKKALKRKEAKKRKSAIEWRERKQVVENTVAERQKRREENLQIRKDNKGKKRSKQQKMKRKFKGTAHLPKRAGFEGRLKSVKKK